MEWVGEGIVLSSRPHGENAAIIEVLSAVHGRHAGVVRGGSGRRLAPVLQPGSTLQLSWRARLEAHIGHFTVEPVRNRVAGLLADPERLAALNALCSLAVFALPEREPQPRLYAATIDLLDRLSAGEAWFGAYLGWERLLLEETGYGLDLASCAVTGATEGLAYVSPRSGRAVTAAGAGEWASRLLPLPPLLMDPEMAEPETVGPGTTDPELRAQMGAGLRVLGHFLTHVLAPALGDRPLPEARIRLAARFR
ncbi:DNA repair protein RecO [Pararhodobacter sp.]|uniref:DNA repair protein RecO n=1 Tax=Pararhodobacter sp. TaxID=2127056 RepID=UPI002FDF0906